MEKTDELPALELRVRLEEDGKYYLTYIREEVTKDKVTFEWNIDNQNDNKGTLIVSKLTDALEDIADMNKVIKR